VEVTLERWGGSLVTDELPIIGGGVSRVLEAGNTVAIEPKMVFPGRGVVDVENTWVVEPGGLRSLTFAEESPV
jgi:Xaa-Pro aminopeptidase